jgi:hypothetical protein
METITIHLVKETRLPEKPTYITKIYYKVVYQNSKITLAVLDASKVFHAEQVNSLETFVCTDFHAWQRSFCKGKSPILPITWDIAAKAYMDLLDSFTNCSPIPEQLEMPF